MQVLFVLVCGVSMSSALAILVSQSYTSDEYELRVMKVALIVTVLLFACMYTLGCMQG